MRLSQQSGKIGMQKAQIRNDIKNSRLRYRKSSEWINSTSWKPGRHVRGTGSSELKRKFQAALPDSQINDSKVPATSAMYPVSDWRKFDWSYTNRKQVEKVLWRLVPWWRMENEQEYWEQEPPPRCSEVTRAIRQTASHKATLLIKSQQNYSKQEKRQCWTECTECVWRSWKLEWTFCTFSPLPKKDNLKQRINNRTIALVSHASKIILRKGSEWPT